MGPSLFFADLISRNFNKVYLENTSEISQEFSELLPPVDKRLGGARLTPAQLTDLLMARSSKDYLDIFSRRGYYNQNVTRYFNLSLTEMKSEIPKELLFLASLYSGWNSEKISREQFSEMEQQLKNFPAQSLAKKLENKYWRV